VGLVALLPQTDGVWEAERQRVRDEAAAAAAAEQARLKAQLEGMQKELNDILNDR
jgi:hypothetical protein